MFFLSFQQLVSHSAYQQSWRDSLTNSLANNNYSDSSNAQPSPELLVSALRHKTNGALFLVGCLTDKHGTKQGTKQSTYMNTSSPSPKISTSSHSVNSDWNRVSYVMCASGALTTTVSVSKPGCAVTSSSYGGEWCPPSFDSRPDLAALNAAGTLWALQEIWDKVSHFNDEPVKTMTDENNATF